MNFNHLSYITTLLLRQLYVSDLVLLLLLMLLCCCCYDGPLCDRMLLRGNVC